MAEKLQYWVDNQWRRSKTTSYADLYNPSTGEVTAQVAHCTAEEVEEAIASAAAAYPGWAATPVGKRVQIFFRMKMLVDQHLEELTDILCREQGKNRAESMGDVLKVNEVIEFACGAPHLMKGPSLFNVSNGYDTVQQMRPLGVFAGIVPWNFPAMIPHGWMAPICMVTGNTMVLKAASYVPRTAMRLMELWQEAGLPPGVLNLVTANRTEAEILLRHPEIKGVSFVGSTTVGRHIYETATANGKRVQALCAAKNHALVLEDCNLERTAQGIINAFCGCAGARCMALPVIVVQESIADKLVERITYHAKKLTMGKAWLPETGMGPIVNAGHKKSILDWIARGITEGADLVLDGRRPVVAAGCENGYFIGPTIFDNVTPEMSIGSEEIFGPVLSVKRVKDFAEGIALMNANPYANGSVIYTESGFHARNFVAQTDGGMVGINVGIPVPVGIFGFTGQKKSFYGDLHTMGQDGFRFYTEQKTVTSTWFSKAKTTAKVDTWDGTMNMG
ncbi:CoA-acylating methylmalonate-semialdehyde dehydrogenase [Desulfotalea psychrophila]|uniref:Related to methylmalonate-semialdehyde dehydrogenase n=1 Tax=Desulfotalea psychrophila (strain LSv54 / DSM 12343) TaxID=177439 RepID=Q6ALY1_DESPS|nr:CoA-acylating methylmalonate-semialdehyde dehydrogenase [Desulfotalea psychrophila]CAG36644.1 related to methylmalonate-semialdehyde dehydrogenase [Desulfotalea psychrophila LSv54]